MIDFIALFKNLNIPKLRTLIHTAWLNIMANPLILIQRWWFFRVNGHSYTAFNPTNDYNIYNYCLYGRASYQCILTPPIGLYPLPTNTNYWYKILDDYIGLNERSNYSAQKVMLEYALNRRFSPTTITPPFSASIPSIYITNNANDPVILWSAPASTDTFTYTAPNSSISFWYSIKGNPTIATVYNYTIHVPTAVVTGTTPEFIYLVTQEANKYGLAGLNFNVVIY
jgi:hypothetical protein